MLKRFISIYCVRVVVLACNSITIQNQNKFVECNNGTVSLNLDKYSIIQSSRVMISIASAHCKNSLQCSYLSKWVGRESNKNKLV